MTLETFILSENKYCLRRAVEEDLDALVELLSNDPIRQAENPAASEHRAQYLNAFRAIDADPAQLLVVVLNEADVVVATMQLTVIPGLARFGATRLTVEAVRVDERLRGNGLGSEMMKWAVAEGHRRNVALVQLTSDKAREDAHRFYERLGFTASHVGFKLAL
ncbi:GNAT family N-acetyltransferase [Glutamicibacter protophormiae]|uniref:GNAT superfamily N-acetyltransferase n=1 Tax=Glutamicibacter protophormiae TaxID=37930 RepID=A0ABS4XQC8_GLUPR|nr:GNAT family N-acetyltransferase [Glutamicibacter protophormiae]MBP2398726.1 GNAT superfamily N-acetyltransferase [Glutamicibacter protophormiae]GGL81994.1 N-acetyltransferase [Glutamicibacter protophormiae]